MATSSPRSEPSLATVVCRRTSTHSARKPSTTSAPRPTAGNRDDTLLRHIRTRKMHRLMMVASEKSRALSANKRAMLSDIVLQRSFCQNLTNGYKQLTQTNAINMH